MRRTPLRIFQLWSCLVARAALALPSLLTAQTAQPKASDFALLDLAELGRIKVISVSKKAEPLWQTASAIQVVTSDDIRRSGATIIPEALRYVPGLEVAQINSHDWAISARGFNSSFANKQLVLVDGRTIYSPFSGGVYWGAVGPPLGEIEQMEIIRGPGATAWGANAVNGVINIVTKHTRETQGTLVSAGGGTAKDGVSYVRHGFSLGEHTWARIYGEYNRIDETVFANGQATADHWTTGRAGLRVDRDLSDTSQLMFQVEASSTRLYEPGDYPLLTPPFRARIPEATRMTTTHALGRWTRGFSAESKLTLQTFWSREQRDQLRNEFTNDTFDLDLTHQFKWSEHQSLVWGGGARYVAHDLRGKAGVVFPELRPTDEKFNAFLQDEIQLLPRRLDLTVGTKLEHNNVTGLEVEPSVRLTWAPAAKQTGWAAISRSVHTPSVLERNVRYDAAVVSPPLAIIRQIAAEDAPTEVQLAYELGYRVQPHPRVSLDATVFYNDLPRTQAFRQGSPFPEAIPAPPHLVVPYQVDQTGLNGNSYGAELAATWQAAKHWRLFAEFSTFHLRLKAKPGLTSFSSLAPRHRLGVRSSVDFGSGWQFDLGVRQVGAKPGTSIASYVTGDARLAWQADAHWEFSVVGQNVVDAQHAEMPPTLLGATAEIPRSVYGKITWRF